ncbi:alpha/beta hydrolase [Nocardioides jishulii]|uniref:DUF1023 domain-containing protein n=1 Tax=Nocardioides jishulii TaxID=2575440 RepID=A0A4U2YSH0_9ACTN|nr:alpha/beta hydrolase [Nocardioides jishulii]QCX26469.1 hypothetical protein FCL41_02095 [Nocardioides jishulii]TKI63725.1 hypothetical protein FC770_00610 [Nocardioides jishulii]
MTELSAATLTHRLSDAGRELGAAAVRFEEFAQEAEQRWAPGVWRGAAREAYAAQVAAASAATRRAAQRWRRVAADLLTLAQWLASGDVDVEEALAWVAALTTGGSLSTKRQELDVVADRDVAHRVAVELDVAAGRTRHRDARLDPDEESVWRNARAVDRMLHRTPGATLWTYDPEVFDGDGAVVVGVGDVRGADHQVVLAPGVGTDVSDVGAQVRRVEAVVDAAQEHGETAGWFWLGYDAPDAVADPAARTEVRAERGGESFARDVASLRDASPGARWTALGHSYGATTVSYAGTRGDLDVDALVLVGAPGAGEAERVGDLGVGEVYVGRDSRDLVATLGDEGWVGKGGVGLGVDPASEEFGAIRFRAERPDRGWAPGVGEAHSGYFTPGHEALDSIGAVVAGRPDLVQVAERATDPWWRRPRDPEWSRDVE